ncbi:hypothetical protein, partial [uncultured Desulfovibrio sp.]|uniref:hypothetical protein n=1 Tax=uncultured Desulfovibrio sp. TaxID=167968 RepID=UPI00262AC6F6
GGMFRWLEGSVKGGGFFWGGAAPSLRGGWNGAEICSVSLYMLTACRQIFSVLSAVPDVLAFYYSKARAKTGNF